MSSRRWKKNKLLGSFLKAKTSSRTGKKRTRPSRVPFSVVESPSTSFAVGIQDNDDMDVEDASDFHQEDASSSTAEPTCPGQQRSHSVWHRKQREAWDRVRPGLLQCFTTSLAMPTQQLCMYCSRSAEYRCQDCSSLAYYCESCCLAHHKYSNIFHYPERWVDGQYVLSPLDGVSIPITHDCGTAYNEKITVVSLKGKYML